MSFVAEVPNATNIEFVDVETQIKERVLRLDASKKEALRLTLQGSHGAGSLVRRNRDNEAYMWARVKKDEFEKAVDIVLSRAEFSNDEREFAYVVARFAYQRGYETPSEVLPQGVTGLTALLN